MKQYEMKLSSYLVLGALNVGMMLIGVPFKLTTSMVVAIENAILSIVTIDFSKIFKRREEPSINYSVLTAIKSNDMKIMSFA